MNREVFPQTVFFLKKKLAVIQEKKTLSRDNLLPRWLDEVTRQTHRGSNKKTTLHISTQLFI